jgi:hypothetical protein
MNVRVRTSAMTRVGCMLGATALTLAALPLLAQTAGQTVADDCSLINGKVPPNCQAPNRDVVVQTIPGENTELDRQNIPAPEGFMITLDGRPVNGDKQMLDLIRRTDLALERADIQVTFDGLSVKPRLDLEVLGQEKAFDPGDLVGFQSATNYPSFLTRGEVRIIDLKARGGPRTLTVVPVDPNGQVTVRLPEGKELVAVHRVYDSRGRYDETVPVTLSRRDDRGQTDGVEEGSDATARRTIPVSGGAVTVYGKHIAPGAQVQTLGEVIRPAPGGDFVIQRILPAGMHSVDVNVTGGGENIGLTREIEIPRSEWFYVGVADLTFGWSNQNGTKDNYQRGRLGFYVKGKTARGVNITASADTGEGDLDTLFRDLDQKDPRSLILRIDPDDYYPVYGDDSTFEEDAPTSGRFYLKLEKDGNHILWGNFKTSIGGTTYLRSERTLYGLQGKWATAAQTDKGEPRASVIAYGASPDNLPQRDIFLGTGGSVYFLQQQDLSIGSETVSIEVRDPVTGRVVSRQPLIFGRDYDINYIQGVVTLTRPLSGTTGGGVVTGGANQVNLVVQYEWTPTAFNVNGLSYGARAEAWLTDNVRIGVTGQIETTATADQHAAGVDLRWELNEDTYAELEYAKSDGPGFSSSFSSNGGLNVNTNPAVAGTGDALRFEARSALHDMGLATDGFVGGYFEDRQGGFSSIDYQVASDEKLWGIYGEVQPSDDLRLAFNYDDYSSVSGKTERTGGAEAEFRVSERLKYTVGLEHTDKTGSTQNGQRTDVAVKATVTQSDALEWYVFGQGTIAHKGLKRNDRIGAGAKAELGGGWSAEGEISDGSLGLGGKALFTREDASNQSYYFGYELDPNRDLDNLTLVGRDKGRFVLGGKRQISSSVAAYGENTYDLFGQRRSLTSAYGVDYSPDEYRTYSGTIELGRVSDPATGDYDRKGLSFSARYEDSERLTATGRIELRRDRGKSVGVNRDSDTVVVKGTARWKLNEAERLLFNLDAAVTDSDQTALPDGKLVDASVGYALRPVTNDRLNVLFKYRFLYDMYGQTVNGKTATGPRQKSHVLTVDAEYDVDRNWTVGGKLGFRLSDTAQTANALFSANDAWLAVATARYHIVHEWDALLEARVFGAVQSQTTEYGALAALYRQFGNNFEVGVGYNFGQFSDDLTDLTQDDKGVFLNLVAKF